MGRINFDANATWGLLPEVARGVRAHLDEVLDGSVLNPSSIHLGGQNAKSQIDDARQSVAALVGAKPEDRIVFTSGATEANNLAIQQAGSEGAVVISAIEHPSVLMAAENLPGSATRLKRVSPDNFQISAEKVEQVLEKNTTLVSLMLANNEIGTVLPIQKIAKSVRSTHPKALLHTDAVQAVGKMRVSFAELGVEMMSVSAHKLGGLTGVGALVVRSGTTDSIHPMLLGGTQEMRLRAGTENLAGIVSFGFAARYVQANLETRLAEFEKRRTLVRTMLLEEVTNLTINADEVERLPNTLSITVDGVLADDLVVALDLKGVSISSGSACASGKPEASHVLLACGLTPQHAKSTIRVSLRAEDSIEQIACGTEAIITAIKEMRRG